MLNESFNRVISNFILKLYKNMWIFCTCLKILTSDLEENRSDLDLIH